MRIHLTRRQLFAAATQVAVASFGFPAWADGQGKPLLRRIKMATLGAADLGAVEDLYGRLLGYRVVERGVVARKLANSWGAPRSAGRRFISLQPASGVDVFVRAVEISPVSGYKPMTTLGWNAVEIIVDDVYKLYESLKNAPYEIRGAPHSLGGTIASVHAMQLTGPADEVVYLTCETGNREQSTLPVPHSFVDRPYIMVMGASDTDEVERFYSEHLALPSGGKYSMPIASIARAQGLPADHVYQLSMLQCAEMGNAIELDRYPESSLPRRRPDGELPPGVAIASFSVRNLADLHVPFIGDPEKLYEDKRAATFIGPASELVELIEDEI